MAREFWCAYHSLIQSLEPFGDEERGRILMAALNYSSSGEEPQLTGPERYIWPTIRATIDRDRAAYEAKCERNRTNAAERYRTQANASDGMRPHATACDGSQEKEKEKGEEKEEEKEKPLKRRKATPPTLEEVKAYCEQRKSSVDPVQFWTYFDAGHWKDAKGQPVTSWKQKLLTWERFDAEKPRKKYTTAAEYVPPKHSADEMDKLLQALDRM